MKQLLLIAFLVFISACVYSHSPMVTNSTTLPVVPETVETQVEAALAAENEYRLGQRDTMLTSGLTCKLFTATGGQRIQATSPGYDTLTALKNTCDFLLVTKNYHPMFPLVMSPILYAH